MRWKLLSVLLLSLLILSSFGSAAANEKKGQQYKVLKILEYKGNIGDTIHGIMDWHENLAMWSIETCGETTSKCTTLYTDIFGPFGDAVFVALEGYYITDKKRPPRGYIFLQNTDL